MIVANYIMFKSSTMEVHTENESGYLGIILGPMYSGKTSRLLALYKKYTFCEMPVTVVNFAEDTRYSDSMLSTHDKNMIPCFMKNAMNEAFPFDGEDIKKYQVFLINEAQFFPDIVEWVKTAISPPYNKIVHISGLDGDFQRNTFGNWLSLITYCDTVEKLTSICCGCKKAQALFSHRLTDEKAQKVIGSDSYIPLCRKCYDKRSLPNL